MAVQIDARGLSCPKPVMLTREELKGGEFPIEVLVETGTSRDNVRRAAESAGCTVTVEEVGDEFRLIITK